MGLWSKLIRFLLFTLVMLRAWSEQTQSPFALFFFGSLEWENPQRHFGFNLSLLL